ncbi:peptide ABC transporter substrate-binding protein [Convivina intestini]|uniref:peptide ABC transporter substrate-binding protein n=1 Tax=Convivina intestini TaxID=1505726 RepID=UPI00200C931D|nr:peptide ABC transporter substrate-binding protein [Convivina intestini]CAH1855286.1 Oligopeptide-binding protein OppA [Convivina intestini]
METWKKWTLAAAAVLVVAGGTRAAGWWGVDKSKDKTTLNYGLQSEIQTLDLSKGTDQYSNTIAGNTGSNLLRMDANGKPAPDLAKSIDVSEDGKTYTAHLRSGLKWSDGSSLTAKDFVYSWQRIVDPKTASQYAYLASGVQNADDIMAGKKPVSDLGVSADGDTITFKLDNPMPQFESLLTFANFMPQKQSLVEKQGSKYGTTAEKQLYSGPYKLEGWNGTNNKFKMVKNDNYWDAKNVKTKTVNWQVVKKPETMVELYKKGEIDRAGIYTSPEIYKANKNNKDVTKVPQAASTYLEYNQTGKNKFLANDKIRQALNMATNRAEATKQASGGIFDTATGLVSRNLTKAADGQDLAAFVNPGYEYDKDKASQLFAEGLKEVGETKMDVTLLGDADTPITKNYVDYLKQAWESNLKGISVTEKFVPFKQRIQDQQNQNFDIVLNNWNGDYPDGSTFYDLFKSPTAGNNDGQFKNQTYIDAITKADGSDANDPVARSNDFKTAEAALKDQANINPLGSWNAYYLVRPNVKNVVMNSTGLPIDLTHAYRSDK